MEAQRNRACRPASGRERHTKPAMGGIPWWTRPRTLPRGREAAIARAEAHERLEQQAQAKARTQPAAHGRSIQAVILARRVRALATRTP